MEQDLAKQIKRISVARGQLMLKEPFWGPLAAKLKLKEMPGIGTCGTNGIILGFNPAFIAKLSNDEIIGLVCHEVMHCVNEHQFRRGQRDFEDFNIACDFAIDPLIEKARMTLPEGKHIKPEWIGKSPEWIYPFIHAEKQSQQSGGQGAGQGGQSEQKQQSQQGQDNPAASGGSGNQSEDQQAPDKEENGGTGQKQERPDAGFGEVWDAPPERREELAADWREATLQAAAMAQAAGKLPAGLDRIVEKIKNPQIPWQETLRMRVQQIIARSDYSFRQPNKRYAAQGMYLPALRSERMPAGVVYWDTSGSMDDQETRAKCAAECLSVIEDARPEKLIIIYGDSKFQGAEEFEPDDPVEFHPKGGGGTDFKVPFEYIESEGIEPAWFIGITDLCGPFPNREPEGYPVLWCATTDEPAPFGEIIRLPEED